MSRLPFAQNRSAKVQAVKVTAMMIRIERLVTESGLSLCGTHAQKILAE
jgi:hypothetical protein